MNNNPSSIYIVYDLLEEIFLRLIIHVYCHKEELLTLKLISCVFTLIQQQKKKEDIS